MLELQFVDNHIWRMNPKKGGIMPGKVNENNQRKPVVLAHLNSSKVGGVRAGLRLEVEVGCNSHFKEVGKWTKRTDLTLPCVGT